MDAVCNAVLVKGLQELTQKIDAEFKPAIRSTIHAEKSRAIIEKMFKSTIDEFEDAIKKVNSADGSELISPEMLTKRIEDKTARLIQDVQSIIDNTKITKGNMDLATSKHNVFDKIRWVREHMGNGVRAAQRRFEAMINNATDDLGRAGNTNPEMVTIAQKILADPNDLRGAQKRLEALGMSADEADEALYTALRTGKSDDDTVVDYIANYFHNTVDKLAVVETKKAVPGFTSLDGHTLPFRLNPNKFDSIEEFADIVETMGIKLQGADKTIAEMKNKDKVIRSLYEHFSSNAYSDRRNKGGILYNRGIEVPAEFEWKFLKKYSNYEGDGMLQTYKKHRIGLVGEAESVRRMGYNQEKLYKVLEEETAEYRKDIFKGGGDKTARDELTDHVNKEIRALDLSNGTVNTGKALGRKVSSMASGLVTHVLLAKVGWRTLSEGGLAGQRSQMLIGESNYTAGLAPSLKLTWETLRNFLPTQRRADMLKYLEASGHQMRISMAALLGADETLAVTIKGLGSAARRAVKENDYSIMTDWLASFSSKIGLADRLFEAQRMGVLSGPVALGMNKIVNMNLEDLPNALKYTVREFGLEQADINALKMANRVEMDGRKIGLNYENPFDMSNPAVRRVIEQAKRPGDLDIEQTIRRITAAESDMSIFLANKMQTVRQEISAPFEADGVASEFFRFLNITQQESNNLQNVAMMASGQFGGISGKMGNGLRDLTQAKNRTQKMKALSTMLPAIIGTGVLYETFHAISAGRDIPDVTSPEGVGRAMLNTGFGGVGSYFFGNFMHNQTPVNAPVWSALGRLGGVFPGSYKYMMHGTQGMTDAEQAKLVKSIKAWSGPVLNGMFTQRLGDYALEQGLGLESQSPYAERYWDEKGKITDPSLLGIRKTQK